MTKSKSILGGWTQIYEPRIAACKSIGLNGAIVLQQVHYWAMNSEKKRQNEHDGRYWVYRSIKKWEEQFPFWSRNTISGTFKKLEELGVILSGVYGRTVFDQTKSYAIDYERLREIVDAEAPPEKGGEQENP